MDSHGPDPVSPESVPAPDAGPAGDAQPGANDSSTVGGSAPADGAAGSAPADGAAGSVGQVWYAGTTPVGDALGYGAGDVIGGSGVEAGRGAGHQDELVRDTGGAGVEGSGVGSARTTGRSGDAAARGDRGIAEAGWLGGEVLESGVERPPADSGGQPVVAAARRWWRSTTAAGPWRRRVTVAAAALAAAGAIVALRAGAPVPPPEEPVAASAPGPVIIYGRARMQPPPFDRLPGRTPIPLPSPVGRPADAVRGTLPITGGTPGETAALSAVRLVLGRYCRYPRAYQVELVATHAWREVRASVLRRWYGDSARLTTLQLRWTGRSYAWQGWPTELSRCA